MKHKFSKLICLIAYFCAGTAAYSQIKTASDELVEIPDVTPRTDAGFHRDGRNFFYFHKSDINFEDAKADLTECYQYLRVDTGFNLPSFVPWDAKVMPTSATKDIEKPSYRSIVNTQYGLVGNLIADIVAGPLARAKINSKLRRCMEPRGYARYALSKDTWEHIHNEDVDRQILIQAKLASGPTPVDVAVSE